MLPGIHICVTTRKMIISDQSISDQKILVADIGISDQSLVADYNWVKCRLKNISDQISSLILPYLRPILVTDVYQRPNSWRQENFRPRLLSATKFWSQIMLTKTFLRNKNFTRPIIVANEFL